MNKVLVISPHPDDESIGCGGTICAHHEAGDVVEVIFLTSGEKGGHGISEEEIRSIREQEAISAAEVLSISEVSFWREPDGAFVASSENTKRLKDKIEHFKPDIIYVTHFQEEHPDHKAAAALVKNTISLLDSRTEIPQVWMYEVWTPIQKIDYIVDITSFADKKRLAIQAHKSQCRVLKFDEAILALNRYRGEMHSWPGGDYAEVFTTIEK